MILRPDEYYVFLRNDLYAFIERVFYQLHPADLFLPNWHIELIAGALEDCLQGKTKRLIVNVPPRSLKSIMASVAFVAYWLGHRPSARIICASYGQDLADKHSADTRSVMGSDWYLRAFGTRLSPQKQSVGELATTARGFRMATSVGGVLTGRGADLLILDDILKAEDALSDAQRSRANDWYGNTLYSRLNSKENGVIVIIQQRLHEDDLVGHVQGQEDWRVIRLPAIAETDEEHRIVTPYGNRQRIRRAGEPLHPKRESLEALAKVRRALGEYSFAGQYQQAPAPLGGGLIKREWFKVYGNADPLVPFDEYVQSWDTAVKASELSSYSVCTTWGRRDGKIYLLDVYRKRVDFPELARAVLELQRRYGARVVLIEDAASGAQLAQQLATQGGAQFIKLVKPEGDKTMRLHAQSIAIENGLVFLPKEAPWLDAYLSEIVTFPASKHSDQVDSTSQALAWISATRAFDREEFARQLTEAVTLAERQAQRRQDDYLNGNPEDDAPWWS